MRESMADTRKRASKILRDLAKAYPDAKIALDFSTPLELLVATILSAQCTDERVNMVTPALFKKYRTAADWARASLPKLEEEIRSTGFYRAKARSLVGMARALVERHEGEVPKSREALVALPGVGLKTANVVLGNAFGEQAIAVDTHVFRVSQRLAGDVPGGGPRCPLPPPPGSRPGRPKRSPRMRPDRGPATPRRPANLHG